MKVRHLSYSDTHGGAAKALQRIHRSVEAQGILSRLDLRVTRNHSPNVIQPSPLLQKTLVKGRSLIGRSIGKLFAASAAGPHSTAILPSLRVGQLNHGDDDIIHLHWIAGETLSIRDVGKITKPLVWTLHDMWPFCGAEHLASDDRWMSGYRQGGADRTFHFDMNAWTWKRKARHWKTPIHMVAPSQWLADLARQSELMKHWPISVIGNCIDENIWQPSERTEARRKLGLNLQTPLIVFGAAGGTRDPNKGFDLLADSLARLDKKKPALAIFGGSGEHRHLVEGVSISDFGRIESEAELALLYSSADVVAVPSRIEAFCQVALEAQACGTPVVTFDASGTKEIVEHQGTGYVAKAFDVEDFARGLGWALDREGDQGLRELCSSQAISRFGSIIIGQLYSELYHSILENQNSSRE